MLFLDREEGQGLVEYALILLLAVIVVVAVLTLLGPQIVSMYDEVITQFPAAP